VALRGRCAPGHRLDYQVLSLACTSRAVKAPPWGLRIDISIGGQIWAMQGWPPEQTFDQILAVDTVNEHIIFTPFARPDQQTVFDAAADTVTMQTLDGQPVQTLSPARAGFKGMLRKSGWDAAYLGYLLDYPCWNYFVTPFLFTYPGVAAREIESWPLHGCSQTASAPIQFINGGTSATGPSVGQGAVSRRGSLARHGPVESRDKSGSTGFQAAPRVCTKQSVAGPTCHRTDTGHTVAERMFRRDPPAMLHVPLRALLYADADGATKFALDQPSLLLASYDNPDIAAVGLELDGLITKLINLLGGQVPSQLAAEKPPANTTIVTRL
jgi:hypothetical protein